MRVERRVEIKESVVVASPPGHKAAPPPSAEAFVSRLMVQVNCTGDFLWGTDGLKCVQQTIYSTGKKDVPLLFILPFVSHLLHWSHGG